MLRPAVPLSGSVTGLLAGIGAFATWGLLVLFWRLLDAVPPFEILCYRIICSVVVLLPVVLFARRWNEIIQALRCTRTLLTLLLSSLIIGGNWFLYIWAIGEGRVLETSLGYYINPLMNVLLGLVFLRERPSRLQGYAIGLALLGMLWNLVGHGSFPWLALSLAGTFAAYGFIRKTVAVEALPGLFVETAFLTPFAVFWVLRLYSQHEGVLSHPNLYEGILLFLSGPVTSLPLVLFAYAARHLRLMTLGLLQYLSPTCTFIIGAFVFKEPLAASTMVTFLFIWAALLLYTVESWRLARSIPRR